MIDVVERRSDSTMLYLKCKDLRFLKLDLPGLDYCIAVELSINALKRLTGGEFCTYIYIYIYEHFASFFLYSLESR